MVNKLSIFCEESGDISELIFEEDLDKRIFTLSKNDVLGDKVQVIFNNPDNFTEIKYSDGKSVKLNFDDIISLKEILDHIDDFKNNRIFNKTITYK